MSDISKVDQDRIDALFKLCDEHSENLCEALKSNKENMKHVTNLMNLRIQQITQKLTNLNSKYDSVHTNNQKVMDKIREKLDEIDAQEIEAKREFDDLRRKVITAKRQKRGNGLVRVLGLKLYDYGIYLLTCLGLHEPAKKPIKDTKRCKNIPQVSGSEHVLTLVFPTNKKQAAHPNSNTNSNSKDNEDVKKSQ